MSIPSWTDFKTVYRHGQFTSGAVDDAQGAFLLSAIVAMACRYCGISFSNSAGTQQSFTETFNGDGSPTVVLSNLPVVAITSVTITADDGSTDTLASNEYRIDSDSGFLTRLGSGADLFSAGEDGFSFGLASADIGFPEGFQNVTVVYTGGYTSSTFPDDLKLAIYQELDETLTEVGIRGTNKGDQERIGAEEVAKRRALRFLPFRRIVV